MQNLRVRLFTRKQQNTHRCCGINLPSHRTGTLYHSILGLGVRFSRSLTKPQNTVLRTLGTYLTFWIASSPCGALLYRDTKNWP